MSGGPAEEKRALRRVHAREARDALDDEERVALAVSAVDRLLELPVFDDCDGRDRRRVRRHRRRAESGGRRSASCGMPAAPSRCRA